MTAGVALLRDRSAYECRGLVEFLDWMLQAAEDCKSDPVTAAQRAVGLLRAKAADVKARSQAEVLAGSRR